MVLLLEYLSDHAYLFELLLELALLSMVSDHCLLPILFFLGLGQPCHVFLLELLLLSEFPLYLLAQLAVDSLLLGLLSLE